MTRLHVASKLSFPRDAVTRTFVVYGGKGKGKTNFGGVLCEELSRAGLRFCVTDPLDVWWGLQHGAKRGQPGIEVVILGGPHGDLPIEPTAGPVIADFVADESVSTVIVMRRTTGDMWTAGERIRFMRDFIKRLFARQGNERKPLHLVVDEAGRFVPQQMPKGGVDIAECVGAIEELVEWGRNVGIGCTLITQRSARMNKSVSELAECMVAFNTTGPNSIAAIVDWFGEHIPRERHKELVASLRKLPVGRALIVSPEWLGFEGEADVRLRHTFDSSSTPTTGKRLRAPSKATKPDLDKYKQRIAAVVKEAKANDPKELKKEIAELKRQAAKPATSQPNVSEEYLDRIRNKAAAERDRHWKSEIAKVSKAHDSAVGRLRKIAQLASVNGEAIVEVAEPPKIIDTTISKISKSSQPKKEALVAANADTDVSLNKTQRRILDALAWYESIGNREPTLTQVGAVALIDPKGGYFSNTVGPLSSSGLVERGGGRLILTDEGRALASPMETSSSLSEYHDVLKRRVRKMRSAGNKTIAMLEAIIDAGGKSLTNEQVGVAVGIDHTGGYYSNTIGPLSTAGLIVRRGGTVTPTDVLFPEGLY